MIFATFPHQALFQSVQFQLVGRSASGGVGLSGATTRVASNSAHWKAEAKFVIYGEERFLAWKGFVAQMQGTLGETLVPAWQKYLPRDGQGRRLTLTDAVSVPPLGFGDNSGLAQTETVHADLEGAAALRDGKVRVRMASAFSLRPGHKIGIGERLHEITAISDLGDGTSNVWVSPLLRQAYPNNERVILDRPLCRMRFETENEGDIPDSIDVATTVTVNFREVI
jgi:hypothetical protein